MRDLFDSALAVVISLFITTATAAGTLPSAVADEGNNFASGLSADIQAVQDAHMVKNGKYWQAPDTQDTIGEVSKGHTTNRKFHDIPESWDDKNLSPKNSRFSPRVDTYEHPDGHGYTITYTTKHAGDIYTMVTNHEGPLDERAHDWEVLTVND